MTDIVERLRDHDRHIRGRLIEGLTDLVIDDMVEAADEIMRRGEALREIAKTDIQTWAKTALEKGDWSIVERIAEVDQQGIACRALAGVEPRAALGEKE